MRGVRELIDDMKGPDDVRAMRAWGAGFMNNERV